MIANLGRRDRLIRAVLGGVMIVAPLLNMPPIWSNASFAYGSIAVGAIMVVTAFFKFCPLYRILGVSTCRN